MPFLLKPCALKLDTLRWTSDVLVLLELFWNLRRQILSAAKDTKNGTA